MSSQNKLQLAGYATFQRERSPVPLNQYDKLVHTLDQEPIGSSVWDDSTSNEEMGIIRHAADSLKAYNHKSDCFKNAARVLQQTCKSIDIDSEEKTKCEFIFNQ
ncbi:hypothetical protein BGZ76_000990 [Entomortierella beljakovae]|nr:hypothetical protein BGZ76_000990 [Entomortierella beljakovae]